jgi:peptidoglycan/xylan/chitin deacetylase (PgdA/CDA1 family)
MGAASRLAGRAVKVVAAAADLVSPPPRGVVVLAYHQIGAPRAGSVNLPAALFDEQLAMLVDPRAAGRVARLDDAVAALDAPAPPRDLVAVTFDDGTADFVEHALPLLVKHRVPATLYLATDFVEQGRSFWDDGTVLSWDALREAVSTGLVDIGSHTHTHALLDRVPAAVVDDELDRSIELIGERLGVTARHFAYPKALAPSPAADGAVRARFASAARAGGRPNRFGATDPWLLARTPIVVSDGLSWFRRKAAGGLRLEGGVRERLDERRYAGAAR